MRQAFSAEQFVAAHPICVYPDCDKEVQLAVKRFLIEIERSSKKLSLKEVRNLAIKQFTPAFENSFLDITGLTFKGMKEVTRRIGADLVQVSEHELVYSFGLDAGSVEVSLQYRNYEPVTTVTAAVSEKGFHWSKMLGSERFDLMISKLVTALDSTRVLVKNWTSARMPLIGLIGTARNLGSFLACWPKTKLEKEPDQNRSPGLRAKKFVLRKYEPKPKDFCAVCWRLTVAAETEMKTSKPLPVRDRKLETRCKFHKIEKRNEKKIADSISTVFATFSAMASANSIFRLYLVKQLGPNPRFYALYYSTVVPNGVSAHEMCVRYLAYEYSRLFAYKNKQVEKIDLRIAVEELKRSHASKLTNAQIAEQLGTTERKIQGVSPKKFAGEVQFNEEFTSIYGDLCALHNTCPAGEQNPQLNKLRLANRLRWLPEGLIKKARLDVERYLNELIQNGMFWPSHQNDVVNRPFF